MMYIIYNSDGSIAKKNINEYIQQGNSYANVLFVTVKDTDIEDYTCSAVITLPNGQNVGGIVEPNDEPVTIEDVEYNGYYITLDETCTLMAGAIRISVALTLNEVRTVTYPIYLNVNATPYDADAPVMISYNQYVQLTNLIESQSYVNNSTITLQKNGVTVGYFSLNQASNKTINYVLSKSDVGLGNVDNTSDATKKSNFTGSIAENNTGFVTGGDVYDNALLKNVDQDINSSKRFINDTELQFYIGSSNPASWYSINDENGNLSFSLSHYDAEEGTSVCDFKIQYNGENLYPTSANIYNLGTSSLYWKNVYATEYFLQGNTHSLGCEYLMTYIKTYSNSVSRKYYFAPSQFFPDANNTSDLGSSDYKFKDLYLAGDSYANEYYIGGGTASSLGREYGNTYIKTFNNNETTKYYFSTTYFSPNNTNAQDLGHSSYKWKDLYLAGNAKIDGKINDLTLPTGTHTLATKDDLVRTILDVSDTSVSALKDYVNDNGGSFNFVYLVNSAGQETDISEAIKNGDYDNITIGNNIFSSTNLLVGTETSPNSTKYFVIRIPFTRKRYLVTGMNLHVLVTGTLYVADNVSPAKPSRFHYGMSWWAMGS